MEKVTVTIKTKSGAEKQLAVYVEEEIAAWLSGKDEPFIRKFIIAEKRMKNTERKETRRHQSLDKSLEGGFDIEDENTDTEAAVILSSESDSVHKALKNLETQQKWLIEQIYYLGRTQAEIASELGVGESAIRSRLKKIYAKLKKFLI